MKRNTGLKWLKGKKYKTKNRRVCKFTKLTFTLKTSNKHVLQVCSLKEKTAEVSDGIE